MFHFQQFSVSHSQSTMKVGTDAVLLGAWLPIPEDCKSILEVGSGCGVISLMLAQKTTAKITGIDIDENSVKESQINAENAPWKSNVQFLHENVQHFAQNTTYKFDVIVSNPPFFENSLKSPKPNNTIAKHNDNLSFDELLCAVDILLSENGRLGLILPVEASEKLEKSANLKQLYVTKKTCVYPTPTKKANRMLLMFERKNKRCEEDTLTIRNNTYTQQYLQLTKEYLTIKNSMK